MSIKINSSTIVLQQAIHFQNLFKIIWCDVASTDSFRKKKFFQKLFSILKRNLEIVLVQLLMETKKCICSKEIRDCSIQYTVTAIENHTHTNYRGRWSGSLNISLNLTVLWSTPHTLQGLLDRVKAQQDAGILLDYTHQQVVYVLLQLNDLWVFLGELRLLLHH